MGMLAEVMMGGGAAGWYGRMSAACAPLDGAMWVDARYGLLPALKTMTAPLSSV